MESIMDVNADAVVTAMHGAGVDRLIHGHTHRPAIHPIELPEKTGERIVLGDWYEHGSVLRVTKDDAELYGLTVD
jgi:UDP-2,3-diacylglucosamine hydrolase